MNAKTQRRVLIAVLVALAVSVALLLAVGSGGRPRVDLRQRQSTFFTDAGGVKALYLLLQELGRHTTRQREDLRTTPGHVQQLWIVNPAVPASEPETDWLGHWIDGGGTLVLVTPVSRTGAPGGQLLRELTCASPRAPSEPDGQEDGSAFEDAGVRDVTDLAAREHPLIGDVGVVACEEASAKGFLVDEEDPYADGLEPFVAGTDGPVVFAMERGYGRVVVIGDALLVSNRGIDMEDNAVLLARIAELNGGGTIAFDERHQGFGATGSTLRAVAGFLLGSPAGWAVVQVVLAGLLLITLRLHRFGPLPPAGPEAPVRRRSMREHVEAFAELYHRGAAHDMVVSSVADEFRRKLWGWLSVPPGTTDEEVRRRLDALQTAPARDARVCLEELSTLQSKEASEKDLMEVIECYERFRRHIES